jgi:hypothetical protein
MIESGGAKEKIRQRRQEKAFTESENMRYGPEEVRRGETGSAISDSAPVLENGNQEPVIVSIPGNQVEMRPQKIAKEQA